MIYFLLAAYNEQDNLYGVLSDIWENYRDRAFKIILVDDGSTDETSVIAKNSVSKFPDRLILIQHEKNSGLGAALKTGFDYLFKVIQPEDIIITLDADNTHPLENSKSMIEKLGGETDIVVASRFCKGGKEIGLSVFRKFLSRIATQLFSVVFKYPGITDYTCGYRAYSGNFLLKLHNKFGNSLITQSGFAAGTEILLKSLSLKPVIAEVPLVLRYDLKKGKSKIKIFRTILAYLIVLFSLKLAQAGKSRWEKG